MNGYLSPKILSTTPKNIQRETQTALLVEGSELLGIGTLVTLYYKGSDEVEIQIGVGKIQNVQQDRKILAIMEPIAEPELWERLKNNETDALERTILKPISTEEHFTIYLKCFRSIGE